jgi:hypothetical protein
MNEDLRQFYERLLSVLRQPAVRGGRWQLLEGVAAWDGNWTSDAFLLFMWQGRGGERLMVAVNYSGHQSQCYVRVPPADPAGRQLHFRDLMSPARYDRDGHDVASRGLYLDLPPWAYHVFEIHS